MVVDTGRTSCALVCAIVLCGGGDSVRVYMVSDFFVIGEGVLTDVGGGELL